MHVRGSEVLLWLRRERPAHCLAQFTFADGAFVDIAGAVTLAEAIASEMTTPIDAERAWGCDGIEPRAINIR